MSAGLLSVAGVRASRERKATESVRPAAEGWNSEKFAREQIRGLVRKLFWESPEECLRQVVFSGVDRLPDVLDVGRRVAEILALDSGRDVALVEIRPSQDEEAEGSEGREDACAARLTESAIRVQSHLWRLPPVWCRGGETPSSWHRYLGAVREKFEYSIVTAPSAGECSEVATLGQFADGLVLLLSAQRTRRAAARRVKEQLQAGRVRILGAVLGDRDFPVPETIYRRL